MKRIGAIAVRLLGAVALAIVLAACGVQARSGAAGPGSLDTSFGSGGKVLTHLDSSSAGGGDAVAVQPDGKIVVAGYTYANGFAQFELARYTTSGALDASFGAGGVVRTRFGPHSDDRAYAVAIQPDGKIVVGGTSNTNGGEFALARYTKSGALDGSFGMGGKVVTRSSGSSIPSNGIYALAIQPDGKIVAAGYSNAHHHGAYDQFALARYTKSGALDPGFGTGGKVVTHIGSSSDDYAQGVAIQPDGKIVVAGGASGQSAPDHFVLARYTKSGALDASFGTGGKVLTRFDSSFYGGAYGVAIQKDGKIVVAGRTDVETPFGSYDFALARFTKSGALDSGFGRRGKVLTSVGSSVFNGANAVAIQPDGKIVVAGAGGTMAGNHANQDFAVARYTESGALDRGFGTGGKVLTDLGGPAESVAIQSDGKIVVAGYGGTSGSNFVLARYAGH